MKDDGLIFLSTIVRSSVQDPTGTGIGATTTTSLRSKILNCFGSMIPSFTFICASIESGSIGSFMGSSQLFLGCISISKAIGDLDCMATSLIG